MLSFHRSSDASPSKPFAAILEDIRASSVARGASRIARLVLARALRPNTLEHWKIALRSGAKPLCDPTADADMDGFRWLESPPGHYWADPFVLARDGRRYLFFEDYGYAESRAAISCAEILPGGTLGPVQRCLDTGSHLSYPMVFCHGGEVFMIPESARAREVALYRAVRFPGEWRKERVLFNLRRASDTTAFEHDGRWWFFTTVSDRARAYVPKLLLFYSDSLMGSWKYHPANPLSSDLRYARGAGAILRHGGRLLRPSQSGSPRYGYSFGLNEIVELTTSSYREIPWRAIEPSWSEGLIATHTYGFADGVEVTDGCVRLSNPI